MRESGFSPPRKGDQSYGGQWAEEIRKNFGLELIVVSREELVTSLLDPANADICRAPLGIPVAMAPELEPQVLRSLPAAAEVADDWQRHALRSGRPLIDLEAEKYDAKQDRAEILTIENIRELLA